MQDTRKYIINLTLEYLTRSSKKKKQLIESCLESHTNKQSLFTEAQAKPEGLLDAARDLIDSQHRGSEPAQNLHRTT